MEANNPKLLAIDDSRDDLAALKVAVEAALPGYELYTAMNGLEGLDLASSEDPDAILLDMAVPGMDGLAVCRKLKADENLRSIPVLFLTTPRTGREGRINALEAGADGFLSFPLDEQELIAQIHAMSKVKKTNRLQAQKVGPQAGQGAERSRELQSELEDRKRVEDALRKSEDLFSKAFHGSPSPMTIARQTDGSYIEVNESFLSLVEYGREEAIGHTGAELNLIDAEARAEIRRQWREQGVIHNVEVQAKTRSGRPLIVLTSIENTELAGEACTITTMTDITERKQAENRIEKLNRVYAMLSEVNQAIVRIREPQALFERACRISVDRGGLFLVWIGMTDGLTGHIRIAAAAGKDEKQLDRFKSWWNDLHDDLHEIDNALRNGQPVFHNSIDGEECQAHFREIGEELGFRAFASFPLRVSDKTRGVASFYSTETGFFDEEELGLLQELAMDISFGVEIAEMDEARRLSESQREALTAQLLQAQKMEAVGRLAGGVAHDFNNTLQVINSYSELVLARLDPADPFRHHIQQIAKAGKRAADLTRQLLAFARKQVIAPQILDLNETIASMLTMLGRLIGEDIDILWKPAKGILPVRMDPSQIDQVLANLTVNSRDAITGNGRITIETAMAQFDQSYCDDHIGFLPGDYVMLAVSDDGSGMSKETLERVFEPFFTTKPQGQGTGLGLATVYGIVKQNEGFINVYSEIGEGTTFRIYLSRHGSESDVIHETGIPVEVQRGNEAILIAEDETAILEIGSMMLAQLGYTVLSAGKPQEALQIAKDHPGAIDLLLTDVVMPEMSGRELWLRLKELRPGLKCIFMSGYTADAIAHRGILEEGIHFLQKPFSLANLAARLREALS